MSCLSFVPQRESLAQELMCALSNICALGIIRPRGIPSLNFWVNNYLGALAPNDTEEDCFFILLPIFPLLKPVYSQGYGPYRISVVLCSESLWDQFLLLKGCVRRGSMCVTKKHPKSWRDSETENAIRS